MGNDDLMLFKEAAHVKIINVSCPQQLLGVLRWIVAGNRGIIYLRILRANATAIYDAGFNFEFGQAYTVRAAADAQAYIVTSGRGVYEAVEASEKLMNAGLSVEVIDMPSIDEGRLLELYRSGKPVFVAEQNNGYLYANFIQVLFRNETGIATDRIHALNTSSGEGLHYIHSGTYGELAAHYGLDAAHLVERIANHLKNS